MSELLFIRFIVPLVQEVLIIKVAAGIIGKIQRSFLVMEKLTFAHREQVIL